MLSLLDQIYNYYLKLTIILLLALFMISCNETTEVKDFNVAVVEREVLTGVVDCRNYTIGAFSFAYIPHFNKNNLVFAHKNKGDLYLKLYNDKLQFIEEKLMKLDSIISAEEFKLKKIFSTKNELIFIFNTINNDSKRVCKVMFNELDEDKVINSESVNFSLKNPFNQIINDNLLYKVYPFYSDKSMGDFEILTKEKVSHLFFKPNCVSQSINQVRKSFYPLSIHRENEIILLDRFNNNISLIDSIGNIKKNEFENPFMNKTFCDNNELYPKEIIKNSDFYKSFIYNPYLGKYILIQHNNSSTTESLTYTIFLLSIDFKIEYKYTVTDIEKIPLHSVFTLAPSRDGMVMLKIPEKTACGVEFIKLKFNNL